MVRVGVNEIFKFLRKFKKNRGGGGVGLGGGGRVLWGSEVMFL